MSPKPAPLIRALRPDDRPEWAGMWADYLAFYKTSVPAKVYAAADANNTPVVYCMTQGSNTTARRLYDRIGVQAPFIKYQRR